MPVHTTPTAPSASQADAPGMRVGHSHSAGKARPNVAPIWLPAAVTSGGKPERKRLV